MTGNWPYLPKGEPKSICEDTSVEKLQETLHEFLDKTSSAENMDKTLKDLKEAKKNLELSIKKALQEV